MIDGIIYKLFSKDADEFYVGSTTNFHNRQIQHKSSCNNENNPCYNDKKYQYIRNNSGFENWDFEILELGEYENNDFLRKIEGEFIRNLKPTLNSEIPNRTRKEYYKDNKEKVLKKQQKYYQDNKEKLCEKKREFYENNKEYYKKYYGDNKEKAKEYNKKYREDNKEIIKKKQQNKFECEFCKSETSINHRKRHQRTKKCLSQRTDITFTTT